MTKKFLAFVVEGKPRPDDPQAFAAHCRKFREGEPLALTLEREGRKRTQGAAGEPSNQNGYLHGVIYKIIGDELGYSTAEMHQIFTRLFLPPRIVHVGNITTEIPVSTTTLSTGDFAEYCDRIIAKAGELGIIIPEPQ